MVGTDIVRVVLVGVGATAVMDMWTLALKRMGVPTLDYAMVGRWTGHLAKGKFVHASIGRADPISHERLLGWGVHYAVGIAFATLLIAVQGWLWLSAPSLVPALCVGAATVLVPLFVMQPALGAGVMASKTPTPLKNCLRSVMTHAVFGLGLYLSAMLMMLYEA